MNSVRSRWKHQDAIKVEWNLGKRCNMDCSYCPAEIHDNFSEHTNIDILKSTVDKLVNIGKPLRISLTGGEPSVHPKIDQLLDYIHSSNIWLSMTTNGTRTVDWYKAQPVSQYVFSLHFEFQDWKNIVKKIVDLNSVWDKDIFIHVMAHQDYMDEVRYAVDVFESANIRYAVRRVRWSESDRDSFDDNCYKDEDLEWLLSKSATIEPNVIIDDSNLYHSNDIIKMHLNKYKNWSCNAGLESLMVKWDGEVYRATCQVGGSLGNIYFNTFVAPYGPIDCTRDFCTCSSDIPITKIKMKDL